MQAVRSLHPPGMIAVISGDLSRYPGFYVSLLNLKVPSGSSWNWVRGNGIAFNRNMVGENAAGDWIWFIDDDHAFEPDILLKMLDRKLSILQPLVSTRKPPFHPYAYMKKEIGYRGLDWSDLPSSGVFPCDAVGTGGMLVRRQVFEAMEKPWFEEGKTGPDAIGEDLHFCTKAKDLGFFCHVDLDNRMGHINPAEIWPAQTDEGDWCIDIDVGGQGVRARVAQDFGKKLEFDPLVQV